MNLSRRGMLAALAGAPLAAAAVPRLSDEQAAAWADFERASADLERAMARQKRVAVVDQDGMVGAELYFAGADGCVYVLRPNEPGAIRLTSEQPGRLWHLGLPGSSA